MEADVDGSPLTPRQVRLVQSMADFQMALSAVDFMCELDDDQPISRVERRRYRCFEDAAVIAYGRPFTDTQGLPTLSFKQLGFKPNADEMSLHRRIMERRHKVIAHSDADRQRIVFAAEKVFDDEDIMLPRMDFDDALAFFVDRWRWIEWLRKLIHASSKIMFDVAQGRPPMRFVRDHTLTGEPGSEGA